MSCLDSLADAVVHQAAAALDETVPRPAPPPGPSTDPAPAPLPFRENPRALRQIKDVVDLLVARADRAEKPWCMAMARRSSLSMCRFPRTDGVSESSMMSLGIRLSISFYEAVQPPRDFVSAIVDPAEKANAGSHRP